MLGSEPKKPNKKKNVRKESPPPVNRIMTPPVRGRLSTIFIPEERRLENNLTKAVEKILTKSLQAETRVPDPHLDKESRRMGLLYSTGTDATRVARQLVNHEEEQAKYDYHNQFSLLSPSSQHREGEVFNSTASPEKSKTGPISRWDVEWNSGTVPHGTATRIDTMPPQSILRSSDALQVNSKVTGGKFHISEENKRLPYETHMQVRLEMSLSFSSIVVLPCGSVHCIIDSAHGECI